MASRKLMAEITKPIEERIKAYALYSWDSRRSKDNGPRWYRDLTVGEAKNYYGQIYAVGVMDMHVRRVRLNGKPKTWKKSPGCELSLVYGLRDYFRVGGKDKHEGSPISDSVRIVIPVRFDFKLDTPPEIVADYCMEYEIGKQ